jgi:hypothetical protein
MTDRRTRRVHLRSSRAALPFSRGVLALLITSAEGCSNAGPSQPTHLGIARVEILTETLGVISVPFRGTTPVKVLARDADGRVVANAPTPTLLSRDTTILIVEPGLVVRSVGQGSTTVVATMKAGGRMLVDSARAGVVVPLGGLSR